MFSLADESARKRHQFGDGPPQFGQLLHKLLQIIDLHGTKLDFRSPQKDEKASWF
jgi:hypothetical protein